MWSGRARDVDARALRFATPWLALMLAVLAAAVVWALVAWGEAG
jgi:hypothetical protein